MATFTIVNQDNSTAVITADSQIRVVLLEDTEAAAASAAAAASSAAVAQAIADEAEGFADAAAENAGFAEEFSGPAYDTVGAGEAATTAGQFFRVANPVFPATLFASSEQGVWYDPSDFSTMFQDAAGTTPVTALGQPVGRINDKSGRNNHATQATSERRPILRQTAGGLFYLENDGVDDFLRSTVNQTVTQPYTFSASLEHTTAAGSGTGLFCVDTTAANVSTSADTAGIYQQSSGISRDIIAARRVGVGAANTATRNSAFVIGTPYVALATITLSPNQITVETGAGSVTTAATYSGTAATNSAFRIFHNGASAQIKFFGGVAINRVLTTGEKAQLLTYLGTQGDTRRTYTRYQRTAGGSVVAAPLATTTALAASTGSGLIGTIAAGSGAVVRNVQDKLRETVSVKDYGAVGDGVANDTAAIQNAFNSGAVSVFLPAGRYRVTANITRSGHTYLYGETMTSSILQMEGTASFIYTGGTAGDEYNTSQLQIERLSFECPTVAAKSVIDASWTGGSGGTSKTFIMRDCEVTGTTTSGGFRDAVTLTNARNIVLESIRILGDRAGAIQSETGFNIIGDNPGGAPVEFFVNKVQCYFVQTAFKTRGWVEGIYLNNSTFVACGTGMNCVATPDGRPLITVKGCHFATDKFGIFFDQFVQSQIEGNLFYQLNVDGTSGAYAGVQIEGGAASLEMQITGNNFQRLAPAINADAIVIQSGTGTERCLIAGNIISGFNTGIWLQPGTTNAIINDDNVFVGNTYDILNQGTVSNRVCVVDITTAISEKVYPDGFTDKWGTSVLTLDASGNGLIALTPPFRTAFLSGTVCNGEPAIQGDKAFSINHAAATTSAIPFSVRPSPGAVLVRVNWAAKGH